MSAFLNIWYNFISGGTVGVDENEDASRIKFINLISLIGFFVELIFGVINLITGNYLAALVDFVVAVTLVVNLITFRKSHNVDMTARILIIAVAAPLMIMLLGGSGVTTGLFWLPMFPVAAYLILGKKQGSTALLILFLLIGLLTLLESFDLVQIAYDFISIRQLILSMLVLAVLMYVHENLKEQRLQKADKKTRELTKAYNKLQSTEKMRDEFTSALAHELRNAFLAIQTLAENWKNKGDDIPPYKAEEYLNLIYETASDNLAFVNGLLDAVNVDTGGFKIKKVLNSIKEIVDQQVTLFALPAGKISVEIEKVIDDDVPWQIPFDSFRLKQVISNLFSNAIKHTEPENKIMVHVVMAADYDHLQQKVRALQIKWYLSDANRKLSGLKDFVLIAISHPEEGIKKEDISKLFKKFSRLQPHDDLHPPEGRGLGLYVIKKIIEAHGGSFGVGSQVGKGVTFYVTLPIEDQGDKKD